MKFVYLAILVVIYVVYTNAAITRGLRRANENGNRRPNGEKWKVVHNNLQCPPTSRPEECRCEVGQKACLECNRCFCLKGMWMCHRMMCPRPEAPKTWAMMQNTETGRMKCDMVILQSGGAI